MKVRPYFYIIEFPDLKLYYAGIRYGNKYPAKMDLLKEYKTSSHYVKCLIQDGYKPKVYLIQEIDDINDLIIFEMEFLKQVIGKEDWINQTANPHQRKK